MSRKNQKFNYDAFASRVVEQAAKVLPYFDPDSKEYTEAAALFKSLEDNVKKAGAPSIDPMLENHLVREAVFDVWRIEDRLRDLGAPTDLEVAFGREMILIVYKHSDLMKHHPTLLDEELRLSAEKLTADDHPPKEWREEVLKKIQAELDNPTIRRRH